MEFWKMTARQTAEAVNGGEVSARVLVEETLDRCAAINKQLNLFVSIAGEDALALADSVDSKVGQGCKLPLAGVPVAVKDDYCYSSLPTTFGSPAFANKIPPFTAGAVEKLIAAGAVVVGKTNLDDFSLGSTTGSSPSGPAVNPLAPDRLAGSAGAAAVSAGLSLLSLESDSGGAVRQGASHCGVFGLRPTAGLVSRYGLHINSGSFLQPGLSGIDPADLFTALSVVSGFDPRDAATVSSRDSDLASFSDLDPRGVKIGWPVNLLGELDPGLAELIAAAREALTFLGCEFVDLDLAFFPEALRAYYLIATAEASSSLSRFDGIRFGSGAESKELEELYRKSRRAALGWESRRRTVFGTYFLSKGSHDLYYRQARKVWSLVRRHMSETLGKCNVLLLPVVKALTGLLEDSVDFLDRYEEDLFCVPVSMTGLPALSVPCGLWQGLPVGLQLVGQPYTEGLLVSLAGRYAGESGYDLLRQPYSPGGKEGCG